MKYQAVIGKILNVHPKDLRTVMPMLVLIFFAGLGLSSAFNSINVALIKNQGAHSLPLIYIISGILLACFSYLYALLEQKLGPAKLLSWVLVGIGIWALSTFAMFQRGTNNHLYILGYVGYFLAYYLFNLLFWGVAALIFSTRQSKYVFSLLTGGESIAKIIGYSLTPLVIYKFNLNYGFIVSGLSFLMAWPIWIYVRKKVHFSHVEHELHSQALHHNPMQQIIGSLKSMPFFKSIAVFSFLSLFIYYLIHYAFLTQVEATFVESSSIAIFFGAVYGFGKFINFGIKGLATSRLIKALGIYRVLLILPVIMFAIHLFGFLCSFSLGMETHLLLWVFTLSILADEFIRSSILKPTFLVLFQPLAKNLRLIGHTIAKGIMEPIGMLIAGLVTLMFLNSLEISLSVLNLIILGFLALWIFTTKQLKSHYKNIILKALERRILPSDADEILLQPQVRSSLNKQLRHSNSLVEFISILKLLNRPILEKEKDKLHYFLESKKLSDDDKLLALDFLSENCSPELWTLLKKWMISSNSDVQEKAIYLLCEIDPEKIEKELKHFQEKDPKLYRVLIGNLLKTGDLNIAIKYGPKLIEMISSINSEERLNGLKILSISDRKDYYQPLLKLVSDSNKKVRIKAIEVAGQFKSRKLIPALLKNLKGPYRSYAEQSLIAYGDKVLPELFKYFNSNSSDKMMMFRMLGEFESFVVNKYIFEKLEGSNLSEKRAAFKALASTSKDGIKDEEHKKIVIDEMISLRQTITQLGLNHNEPEIWNEAVKTELKTQLEAILHLVVILNGKDAIGDSIDQLYWGTPDTISNAIERIETTVDYKTRKEIIPLFEKIYVYQDYPKGKRYADLIDKVLSKEWEGKVSQWLTAVAIRSNQETKAELLKSYPHLLTMNTKIVKEEIESYHE